jgi:hypothetical protein
VLVIIGLIVGGVLLGQELISQAATRAQIAQIEKYNTAVNTFRTKYAYIPGDIPDPYASQFGFQARGQYAGQGDGNGLIDGCDANSAGEQNGTITNGGETGLFWNDLSTAGMIPLAFSTALTTTTPWTTVTTTTNPSVSSFFPAAKMGNGNYIYVWSGGPLAGHSNDYLNNGINYFGLSAVVLVNSGLMTSNPGLTVQQAYNIDKKVDDGMPQSGRITAMYLTNAPGYYVMWAGTSTSQSMPWTTATPGSAATCFDNGGVAGPQQYSTEQSGGTGMNCALSFQIYGMHTFFWPTGPEGCRSRSSESSHVSPKDSQYESRCGIHSKVVA